MTGPPVFQKVIVGCDGESPGRDALALGHVLGALSRTGVLAVGVHPDPLLPFPRRADLHEECERVLCADRDVLAPEARVRAVTAASPVPALQHAVDLEHADLLVLGSTRGTERGRVHAGRHARRLLHGAHFAVALAPSGYAARPAPLRRILVGIDGSGEGARALACARSLATAGHGRLSVLTAIDPMPPTTADGLQAMPYLPDDWEELVDLRRQNAHARLADATAALGPDVEVRTLVVDGDPARALCEAGRDADMLVLGSARWGPFARLVLGGTAEHVIRHARCPVLVMPRRDATAPPAARERERAATAT